MFELRMFFIEIRQDGSERARRNLKGLSKSGLSVFLETICGYLSLKRSSKKAICRTIPRPLNSKPAF
jgi:hypothetical protein